MAATKVTRSGDDRVTAAVVAAVALSCAVLLSPLSRTTFGLWYDDAGLAVCSLAATVTCGRRAGRSEGKVRQAWSLLAAGCGAYTLGEAWWCWLELGQGTSPFPSLADVGYLTLPVLACAALLIYPVPGMRPAPGRRLLDAVMVSTSLTVVSWELLVSPILSSGGETHAALNLSVAYLLSDVAVLTVALVTAAQLRGRSWSWWLVSVGLALLCLADTGFACLSADGNYDGGPVDVCYFVAFLVVATAALARDQDLAPPTPDEVTSFSRTPPLPYVPALVALGVTVVRGGTGHLPTGGELALLALLVVSLLVRQYLALHEITTLGRALSDGEARLRHQALHDALTGLSNRRMFHDRLEHALALHARDRRPVSVLFLDLDDFKIVNDTHGHVVGDELLVRIADRLTARTRVGDTVARLGGDEFAVLLEDGGDARAVASYILAVLARPVLIGTRRLTVTASLGIVALDADTGPTSADQLMTQADTAMYAAKRSGKGRVETFRAGMSLSEVAEQQQADDLLDAIRTGAVTVVYQPIIDTSDGSVRGLEALARWTHLGEQVPPDVFIPLAERSGVIRALTDHVLELACSQLAAWTAATGLRRLMVGVNVPTQQLVAPDFVARVAAAIERHGLGPQQLVVEITESELIRDTARARQVIDDLHGVGAQVSLDDFGVGYSSLARLHQLQLDSVKVDKSFLDHIDEDPEQARFVSAILALGRSIDLPVIAEGIERGTQLEELRRLGGTLVQGWYFARGLPAEDVARFVAERARARPHAIAPG